MLVALVLAGVGTASLVATKSASAYTTDQLAGLGYSVVYATYGNGCHGWQASYGNGQRTDLGSDCDPDFQQRLDDFVAATCPCAQTTTTAEPETTAVTTTTEPATTTGTTPVETTTAPTDPPNDPPASPPAGESLTSAGDAAQDAFEQAVSDGADTATAAAIARGTYLNAEYNLGDFA